MIAISTSVYAALAARLTDEIGGANYYNGSIEADFGEVNATFRATLIVYHHTPMHPADQSPVRDIVPVWWQFDTSLPEGAALNDFDWYELKALMVQ